MGNCLISIHVTGAHHNGLDNDIDQMTAKFVDELKKNHTVAAATITSGGEQNIADENSRFPLRRENPSFYNR